MEKNELTAAVIDILVVSCSLLLVAPSLLFGGFFLIICGLRIEPWLTCRIIPWIGTLGGQCHSLLGTSWISKELVYIPPLSDLVLPSQPDTHERVTLSRITRTCAGVRCQESKTLPAFTSASVTVKVPTIWSHSSVLELVMVDVIVWYESTGSVVPILLLKRASGHGE